MCLAVPARVVEVRLNPDDPDGPPIATVDLQGSQIEASLAMTPEAAPGDWLLIHAGFALTILDEQEAAETFETLREALYDPRPAEERA